MGFDLTPPLRARTAPKRKRNSSLPLIGQRHGQVQTARQLQPYILLQGELIRLRSSAPPGVRGWSGGGGDKDKSIFLTRMPTKSRSLRPLTPGGADDTIMLYGRSSAALCVVPLPWHPPSIAPRGLEARTVRAYSTFSRTF